MNAPGNGLITLPSPRSVDEVVSFLIDSLKAKGIHLFCLVDHSGEAAKVGMALRPTKLLIFGNAKSGTPLMQASVSSAIDLPLKILVWEDDAGSTHLTYNSAKYLGLRHGVSDELLKNLAVVEVLVAAASH